jgi:hypothetical protein
MPTKIVPQNGQVTVTLTAGESIAVYSAGTAVVSRALGYPNHPYTVSELGEVTAGETTYGSYSAGATIIIDAGPLGAEYESGVSPRVRYGGPSLLQGAPVAVDTTGAVSAAAMLGGIVTSTTAAAVAGTVPTGTVMDAADTALAIGDCFDWSVINTGGANAFTVTAASGHTLVGAAAVAASTSGRFRTRKTAAATYITYRIS